LSKQLENTDVSLSEVVTAQPPIDNTRSRRRFRFRLRTFLLAPLIVVALLLIAFPKLITGDFVKATVRSIENDGASVRIEMDALISSGTGWGATLRSGAIFGTLGTGGNSEPHWTQIIPTWPRRQSIIINLGLRKAPPGIHNGNSILMIKQGTSYHVTTDKPLWLARDSCELKLVPGSRTGL
jgi:hypothetical protein